MGYLFLEKAVRKLLVASQKSGVGKTTTSMNLAASTARNGTRVLLLDADPLSNISAALKLAEHPHRLSLRQAGIDLPGVLVPNLVPGLDVLSPYDEGCCSDDDLDRLLRALTTPSARTCYGCMIVDVPPFMGANPAQLIASCDEFLLVMRAEPMAYRTLPAFLELIQRSARNGHTIQMRGILLTLAEGEEPGCRWERELRGRYGARILSEVIPHDETIDKSLRVGQIACHLQPDSPATRQFRQLCGKLGLDEESRSAASAEQVTQALREAAAEVGPSVVTAPAPATTAAPSKTPNGADIEDRCAPVPEIASRKPMSAPIQRPRRSERSSDTVRPGRPERAAPPAAAPLPPSSRMKKKPALSAPPVDQVDPAPIPASPAEPAAANGLAQLWPLWILLGAVLGGGLRFLPPSSSLLPILVGLGVGAIVVAVLYSLATAQNSVTSPSSDKVNGRLRPRDANKNSGRSEAKKDPGARLASLTNGLPKGGRRHPPSI